MFSLVASVPSFEVDSAWIDRSGKWFQVDYAEHHGFAQAMLQQLGHDNVEAIGFRPVTTLEQLGWMHISDYNVYLEPAKATQSQIDTLYDWYSVVRVDYGKSALLKYIKQAQ